MCLSRTPHDCPFSRARPRRFKCRPSLACVVNHGAGSRYTCSYVLVQDLAAVCHFTSWYPKEFFHDTGCKLHQVPWHVAQVQAYADSLSKRDWAAPPPRVDPSPVRALFNIECDKPVSGTTLAMRLIFFPPESGRWFTGVQAADKQVPCEGCVRAVVWPWDVSMGTGVQ